MVQEPPSDCDDDVTGTYYDGSSGEFITVTAHDEIEVYYADDTQTDAKPITTYESVAEFRDGEPDLIPVPDSVIDDPVSVAEEIFNAGFKQVVDGHNFAAVMWANEHTKIIED